MFSCFGLWLIYVLDFEVRVEFKVICMLIGLRVLIYRFLFPSAIPAVLLIVSFFLLLLLLMMMVMVMMVSNPTLTLGKKLYFVLETYRPFCGTNMKRYPFKIRKY